MKRKKTIRIFDFLVALILAVLLFIPALLIAILIKLTSRGPILFIQKRVGYKARPFRIYKFRTMTVGRRTVGAITIGNDSRITKLGKILRKTKLDEIPQLINVLKGEMSFVGFRPDTPEYTKYYRQKKENFFDLMPGITGKASIYLRTIEDTMKNVGDPKKYYIEVIIPKKVELNEWHFKNNNIWSNVKVMFETVYKLIIK